MARATRLFGVIMILVLVSNGAALAAVVPKAGRWKGFSTPRGGKDDEALFVVKGSEIFGVGNFTGKEPILVPPTDFKCNEAFIELPVKHLLIKHGGFSYHGVAYDTIGTSRTGISGTLTWTAKFTSSTTVKGTVRFQTNLTPVFDKEAYKFSLEEKPCDTGTLPWTGSAGIGLNG